MAVRSRQPGPFRAVHLDLWRLHERWMGLRFPRRRPIDGSVATASIPATERGRFAYTGWAALGVVAVAVLYPLVVFGFGLRPCVRRVERAAGLGVGSTRVGGRTTTVLLAYPVVTAVICLVLAVWSLVVSMGSTPTTGLFGAGLAREGLAVAAWLSIPAGWAVGCAITLADLVRPIRREQI